MIEIAISLAVIGFALVAIIGILPTGLDVQKQNKEETIVNQEAQMWMEAIRNGAQGMNDLTNYVEGVTNFMTVYDNNGGVLTPRAPQLIQSTYFNAPYPITNGYRIVGLLTTPKYTYDFYGNNAAPASYAFTSNYNTAIVRSMSGGAFEKAPQDNRTLLDAGFRYKLISEVVPYYNTDFSWIDPASPAFQGATYTNLVRQRYVNFYDIRLIFRWPVITDPAGNVIKIGNSRLVFRTQVSGFVTNMDNGFGPKPAPGEPRYAYFFESRNYVQAKP